MKKTYELDWIDAYYAHRVSGGLYTPEELTYLAGRLEGLRLSQIGERMGISKQALWQHQRMVWYKYQAYRAVLMEDLLPGDTSVGGLLQKIRKGGA